MWINLHGISYAFALLSAGALFILCLVASLIVLLVQRAGTGLPLSRLKAFCWFLAAIFSLLSSMAILLMLGQSKDFVNWLDHTPWVLFFLAAPYGLSYILWLWWLRGLSKQA